MSKSTSVFLYGYVALVLLEYGGIVNTLAPALQVLRLATLLTYLLLILTLTRIGIGDWFKHRQTKIFLFFVLFTTASVAWALVRTFTFESIRPLVDYTVFFFLTVNTINRQRRADVLSWTLLVVAVYLTVLNSGKLLSAVRSGAFAAPYFMGDGNDFAWGMVVMLPLILNLTIGQRGILERAAGLVGGACCLFSIVGTSSRGATLGLAAMALYYLLVVTKRKGLTTAAYALVAAVVLMLAPSTYFDRMKSISEYEEDNSALTRLQAWSAAVEMAVDYPLGVGAGNFSPAYGRFYIPTGDNAVSGWASQRWVAAHSIYFRTLGEYGFIGLSLLIWLIITNVRDNLRTQRTIAAHAGATSFSATWPGLLSMACIGHAVCGIFLGGVAYPHLFLLCGLTVAAKRYAASLTPAPTSRLRR